ncbi:MAG TPA: hypothetical protein VK530_21665 [Candidatus Acidoferrum sp.]|nr:hypothetical protein [Candidatus Acidoferrum sp.]
MKLSRSAAKNLAATIVMLLTFATTIYAHPGHDMFDQGVAHMVASPFHLALLAVSGIALAALATFVRTPRARASLRFGALTCIVLTALLGVISR